jgi:large subunit ribosomal protein L30
MPEDRIHTDGQIRVKQVRSAIGVKPKQRGTLRALGLGRIGRTAVLPDRPEIRGMVANVVHLVEVENDGPVKSGSVKASSVRADSVRAGSVQAGVKK